MMPIVLTGLPGAGKTRVGRALAGRLGCDFFDTDAEIERRSGLSVASFFETYGEARFREVERRVTAELSERDGVIALGGGTFQDSETRTLLLGRCRVVWLDPPRRLLIERIARSTTRPLFAGRNAAEVLDELAAARTAAFAQAPHRIRAESADAAVRAVLAAFGLDGESDA